MTTACQGSHCFSPDGTEGHLCPAAGTQRGPPASPSHQLPLMVHFAVATTPWQTSPALQDLGPENTKTFKAKSIVSVYILKKLPYTCAPNPQDHPSHS